MSSFYVATKWENRDEAKRYMNYLTERGHTITYDWTQAEKISPEQAAADLAGVVACDVFIGIFEQDVKYEGALIELGAALGLCKTVYIIGNAPVTKGLFFQHPTIHHVDDLEMTADAALWW